MVKGGRDSNNPRRRRTNRTAFLSAACELGQTRKSHLTGHVFVSGDAMGKTMNISSFVT